MKKNAKILVYTAALLTAIGCNVKLDTDVGVLPGLKGEFPKSSGTETGGTSGSSPTEVSRNNTKNGTKTPILNLVITPAVKSATAMSDTLNCAQMAQFDNGTVMVDFSNQSCPSDTNSLLSPDSIKFSLGYHEVGGGGFELLYLGGAVGLMKIDFDKPLITLESLCSSGYSSKCFLSTVSNGRVDNLLKF